MSNAASPVRYTQAAHWFFPAAAVYAALAIPLSLMAFFGHGLPAATISTHGAEMLFGFGLALIAGYLGGALRVRDAWLLFGLWLVARVLAWTVTPPLWSQLFSSFFAVTLGIMTASRFQSARQWRNRYLMPLLLLLGVMPLGLLLTQFISVSRELLFPLLPLILFSQLMMYMGGRVIAPLISSRLRQQGEQVRLQVQPEIEGALLAISALALMLVLVGLHWTLAWQAAGVLLLLCAVLVLVRLLRWQPWRQRGHADLLSLCIGYFWLVPGLAMLGIALLQGETRVTLALHVITIGAMGTLAAAIILRQWYWRLRHAAPPASISYSLTALIGAAALLRLGSVSGVLPYNSLWLAAACWTLAFSLLAVTLWRVRRGG